jgi:NADH dehydrogenase
MSGSPKLVTIFGGSGFVGRYIARRMAKEGWRVRVAVRRPNEAIFVRPYGGVGQVEPIFADIRNDGSVQAALAGSDAVVNCVGILNETSRQKFEDIHAAGAGRIARIAAKEGVKTLVHFSAIGANKNAESESARTKAEGERLVKKAFKSAVILRPSIVFGNEDEFFNRFALLAKFSPVVPLVGADTKFQPVYVDDLAVAAVQGVLGKAKAGIYELGGPEIASFHDLISKLMIVIRRKRLLVNVPFFVASIKAWGFDMMQKLSLGLFTNRILTRDQVKSLKTDNIVSSKINNFKTLGIEPTPMDSVMEEYLYRHRPYGQYTELTETAGKLKA